MALDAQMDAAFMAEMQPPIVHNTYHAGNYTMGVMTAGKWVVVCVCRRFASLSPFTVTANDDRTMTASIPGWGEIVTTIWAGEGMHE